MPRWIFFTKTGNKIKCLLKANSADWLFPAGLKELSAQARNRDNLDLRNLILQSICLEQSAGQPPPQQFLGLLYHLCNHQLTSAIFYMWQERVFVFFLLYPSSSWVKHKID